MFDNRVGAFLRNKEDSGLIAFSSRTSPNAIKFMENGMDDIFAVCDRVMALFHGKNFAEAYINETSHDELIGWVMGASQHRETV